MASSLEQKMAAARERVPPIATAPGVAGGGTLDPQRRAAAAAALLRRMDAYHEWAQGSTALASARPLAQQTFSRQEQLKGLKDQLRDLQSQLTETLSVKLIRESKAKLTTESISDATTMIERLRSLVTDLRDKRDKRTSVITEQLQALDSLEAKSREDEALREEIDEAVLWYAKFLGLQIVRQKEGVKFVFNNVDVQSPEKEYSFPINFDKDRYNLLECDVRIKDVEELMKGLSLSDDLAKFLRIVRENFQSSAMNGTLPVSPVGGPDVSTVPSPSPSPMVTSVEGRSEDVTNASHSQSKNNKQPLPVSPVAGSDVSAAPSPSPMGTSVEGRSEDVKKPSCSRSKNKKQSLLAKRGATALSAASPGNLRRSSRTKGQPKQILSCTRSGLVKRQEVD